jgi:hypothetical protein
LNASRRLLGSWKKSCTIALFLLSVPAALAQEAGPVLRALPLEEAEVISHTQQFRIQGSDSATRAIAANLAEEAKSDFLNLIEQKDEWKIPIRVGLKGKQGDPTPLRETVIRPPTFDESGFRMEILVNLSLGLRKESFKRVVSEALLYAYCLESLPKDEADIPLLVPQWMIEGLLEAISWQQKLSDRKLYDSLFRHGGLFQLDDLFELNDAEHKQLDAMSKAAFRVSAGAVVMALIEQTDGKAGVRNFLKELASHQGEVTALLRKHFPDLNLSESSLEKWWALQLANKGMPPLTESLSIFETEHSLKQALGLRYQDAEKLWQEIAIEEWQSIAELSKEERNEAVRSAQDDLLQLSYRCFPSYRVLLLEYQSLLIDFSKGNTDSLTESLATLTETRSNMLAKAERARDFLDFFEITRARETSGAFDDYLKLKAQLKNQPNPKQDHISRYLDRLDPLFNRPELKNRNSQENLPPDY